MYGREHGVRMGIGGIATTEMREKQRQKQINKVLGDVYRFSEDPYMMTNDMNIIECKLCHTTHKTKENYLLHTEGKKHKENLAVREFHVKKQQNRLQGGNLQSGITGGSFYQANHSQQPVSLKPRIGKPQCFVLRQFNPSDSFHTLAFKIVYSLIERGLKPRYRIIGAYEQSVETPHEDYQYLVFAAEPYENVAFKIPNVPIDNGRILREWDSTNNVFYLQIRFKDEIDGKWRKAYESGGKLMESLQMEDGDFGGIEEMGDDGHSSAGGVQSNNEEQVVDDID